MWSLCIIDLDEQVIFAARDPFGIKPFYYTARNGRFAFASELKSLLALPWVERNVNPQTVWDYLQVGRTGDRNDSIVQGIAQLPHAHYMTISLNDQGAPSVRRYWDIDISRDSALSREEAVQRVREGFLANVIQHLRSDVAVAATLSGGIDSSAIVSSIRHLLPDDQLINTFSFVTDDPTISEEPFMRAVAEAKGAKIHCVTPTANELVSDLDNLIRTQDEPFGSTTIYAQYRVFGIIQQAGIKVVLDGQGADEMLGGYRGYLLNRCASLIRSGKPVNLIRLLWNISRFTSLSEGIGAHWGRALKQALQYPDDAPPLPVVVANSAGAAWLNGAYFHERNVVSGPQQPPPRTKNVLRERLKQSLMETSLPELLRFEDRNSMGHSIESRVPFLTTDFVELVLSLPEEFLIDNRGESKSVFRSAMRGLVPDVVLDRRDKIGFDTPEQAWLSTLDPWVTDVLGNADQNRFTALELSAMRREWSQVQAGNRPYTKRYWRWINLIRWAEIFDMSFA
jgi:asparagine synthase (glutamine-hydrolysing)